MDKTNIISVTYGSDKHHINITSQIVANLYTGQPKQFVIYVNNQTMGSDPDYGVVKKCTLKYTDETIMINENNYICLRPWSSTQLYILSPSEHIYIDEYIHGLQSVWRSWGLPVNYLTTTTQLDHHHSHDRNLYITINTYHLPLHNNYFILL